jgi:serine/threonine protein phosphatase PrpC
MHQGLRTIQEDCVFINGKIFQNSLFKKILLTTILSKKGLFAVCDGIGGRDAGEWASRYVCEKLGENLPLSSSSPEIIEDIFRMIQNQIEGEQVKNSGTTVAGVVLDNGKTGIFNAGDSRVYKITHEQILRMSHDHSLLQTNIDRGYLTVDQASSYAFKHVIEFGIGGVFQQEWKNGDKNLYIREDVLQQNECYLICSDGVYDVLKDEEIFAILHQAPFAGTTDLVACIKERMKDNFSFILIGNDS